MKPAFLPSVFVALVLGPAILTGEPAVLDGAKYDGLQMSSVAAVDTFGVNLQTSSWEPEKLVPMLRILRTRNLRDQLSINGLDFGPSWKKLTEAMVADGQPRPQYLMNVMAYVPGVDITTWEQQQRYILKVVESGVDLRYLSGPNEVNGLGTHGPHDKLNRSALADWPALILEWEQAKHEFLAAHQPLLAKTQQVSPSLLVIPLPLMAQYPDVSAYADAGDMHYYAGSGYQPGIFNQPVPGIGYFRNTYEAIRHITPGKPIFMTEFGATTTSGVNPVSGKEVKGGYARTGESQAKYLLNQMLEYLSVVGPGGKAYVYKAIDDGHVDYYDKEGKVHGYGYEDNYGMFYRDGQSGKVAHLIPKPSAYIMSAFQDLNSPGNDYFAPANWSPGIEEPFVPSFDARDLMVSKLKYQPTSGKPYVVLHRPDGVTNIWVWNEPPINDKTGHNLIPEDEVVTLKWPQERSFRVYDPMTVNADHALAPLTATAKGTGTTVILKGYGMCVQLDTPPGFIKAREAAPSRSSAK